MSSEPDLPADHWYFTFDATAGYDCMSAAYKIYRGDELMFVIDTIEFIDELRATWVQKTAPNPRAEALARAICQRMSGY